jgi:uncharacterized protein (TIGR00730 family)
MVAVKRLCVYCGSSPGKAEVYRAAATRLGVLLAEAGIELVYGGGRIGLMGMVADAVLSRGGRVTGIIPGHLHDLEVGHAGISHLIVVDNMHERKRRMFEMADAFAILPGGLGTLDETFEIITWKQLGLHDKPIFLIDVAEYWAPLIGLIDHVIGEGFASGAARGLFEIVARVEELLPALSVQPQPKVPASSNLV